MQKILYFMLILCCCTATSFAQREVSPVEINGDHMEFDVKTHTVIATGNVVITRDDTVLRCDHVEFSKITEIARVFGPFVLEEKGRRTEGNDLVFNFKTKKGDFNQALFTMPPLYGAGERVEKINDEYYRIYNGYVTNCDFDQPQSRVTAKTIDVYPGDVAVARNMVFRIGKVPVFFWPKYTEDLKNRGALVRITPGYKSAWGGFVLSRWRFDTNEDFKTFFHLDYRERKDVAWGIDNEYNTHRFGEGSLRTYYMNERDIGDSHIFKPRLTPTIEKERYKVEWRHRWEIDDRTLLVSQYYKISDEEFLKDYFEREYEEDQQPNSYAVLTKGLKRGTLSARADFRVNRYESRVDRLPEVSYTLPSLELGESNFYWKNTTTFSSLWQKNASPTDSYAKTKRFHLDNEISYPEKVAFLEVRPFVGTRHTYYSRTNESAFQNAVRGVFRTGFDISTKFYRIYEVETNAWDLDINNLRHVVTPSIAYEYQHDPTVKYYELDQYDEIDALNRVHRATLSLENKLQTKRDGENVDLVRLILSTDYAFKDDAALKSSFNNVTLDLETEPYEWLGFYFDSTYDPQTHDFQEANFDLYVNDDSDRWFFRLGERYRYKVDNQFEVEVGWKLNPKWEVRYNEMFDVDTGKKERREIFVRRDLHSWLLDFIFTDHKGAGREILFAFTLKEFDDARLEFGRSYRRFKGGAARPGAN